MQDRLYGRRLGLNEWVDILTSESPQSYIQFSERDWDFELHFCNAWFDNLETHDLKGLYDYCVDKGYVRLAPKVQFAVAKRLHNC